MSITQLAQALEIDKAAASRRWQRAKAGGYLSNLEDKRGKPARIVLADPLPEDVQVLPTVEQLRDRCTVDRVVEGVSPLPPPEEIDQDEIERLAELSRRIQHPDIDHGRDSLDKLREFYSEGTA
jgi:hypothetical protein